MKHVVMYSGGVASWATAKRVKASMADGDTLILLFADTKTEDFDLYRFLDESAANVGGELVKIAEGRSVWQTFFRVGMMGSSRADPCSRILKREFMRKWLDDNCDPADTTVHIGFTWDEAHRWERARGHWDPWPVAAPLTGKPYLQRRDILNWLKQEGIEPPLLTRLGFPHNNCGGFCVKAGHAQFAKLLAEFPARYRHHERMEQAFRELHQKDVSILRSRKGGETTPLTLKQFREHIEAGWECDLFDWGGCACLEPGEDEEDAT